MKKILAIVLAVAIAASIGGVALAGDSQPASKATAKIGDLEVFYEGNPWGEILTQTIKVPSQKDLFVDVSLQCGLYTDTTVKSKGMQKDTSSAQAQIGVKVEAVNVDTGEVFEAMPAGWVVFADRTQTLSATLQGAIDFSCVVVDDPDGIPDSGDEVYDCTINSDELTEEEIQLIQETMNANSFNYVIADLPSGTYDVIVSSYLFTLETWQQGETDAWGTIGWGSVTIETVRMIQGEDIPLELINGD